MKILLISDIHANVNGLRAVAEAEQTWDAVWCLGDMVEFGFHPHETVAWLREHHALAVAGNHDVEILNAVDRGVAPPPADQATNFLDYALASLTEEDIAWLRTVPKNRVLSADGYTYYLAHYYTEAEHDPLNAPFDQFHCYELFNDVWKKHAGEFKPGEQRRILYGHSHQCMAYQLRPDMVFLNPGSLSYRIGIDGETCKGADYMVIENGEFRMKHVDFDTTPLMEQLEKSALTGISRDVAKVFSSPQPEK